MLDELETLIFPSIHKSQIKALGRCRRWFNKVYFLTMLLVTFWLIQTKDTMSYVAKGEKEYDATGAPVPSAKIHKIRITLTSGNVRNLEKCSLSSYSSLECCVLISMLKFLLIWSAVPKTSNSVSKAPFVFLPKFWRSQPVRRYVARVLTLVICLLMIFFSLVVRVPRHGIVTSSRFINVWSTCMPPVKLSSRLSVFLSPFFLSTKY